MIKYAFVIEPISDEDGGGFMAFFPDLPGCMSDGETPEEAAVNAQDALKCWVDAQLDRGAPVPGPGQSQKEFVESMTAMSEDIDRLTEELAEARRKIAQLEGAREGRWERRPRSSSFMPAMHRQSAC